MKASKDLPVWNEAETDVLPRFQLTFGHVILPPHVDATKVVCALGSWSEMNTGEFHGSELPLTSGGEFGFANDRGLHFLVLKDGGFSFVFADRQYFFRNECWLSFSKEKRVAMVVCVQMDEDSFFYELIENGSISSQMKSEAGRIVPVGPLPMQIWINSELVWSSRGGGGVNPSFEAIVQSDVRPANQNGKVVLVRAAGGELVDGKLCRHLVGTLASRPNRIHGALMRFIRGGGRE